MIGRTRSIMAKNHLKCALHFGSGTPPKGVRVRFHGLAFLVLREN
jgi:hypothetical protein